MMRKVSFFLMLLLAAGSTQAQDSLWTLQRAVQYAVEHNLDIKQSVLNERLTRLQLLQSQLSQLPNGSISSNVGRSYGRSIDPTTNQFINAGYTFAGLNGNVDVLLFGWFQKRNTINQNRLLARAANADIDQLKDDISLNVATAFLRILLAAEQIKVNERQLQFSLKQKEQTTYFVNAGRLPELDLAQMQAQVATDSSNYITAIANYQLSLLDIKAIMNFEISEPFAAMAPNVNDVPVAEMASLNPEDVYNTAKDHFGAVASSKMQIEAARKGLAAWQGALLPQLAIGGQFGTNYSSVLQEVTNVRFAGLRNTENSVFIDNVSYSVQQPIFDVDTRTTPLGTQFGNNFRQTVALSLSVPLFNGWSTRSSVNRAKVDVQTRQISLEQTTLKLKQDVYKAYYDAKAAVQKYYAANRAAEASSRASSYAEKRYELGLMNALELLTTQNNAYKASSEALSAKYDLLFKLKVIDYYLGKEIKL